MPPHWAQRELEWAPWGRSAMIHDPPALGTSLLTLLPTTILQTLSALSWECKCAKAAVAVWTVYLVWSNYAKKVIIILCSLD